MSIGHDELVLETRKKWRIPNNLSLDHPPFKLQEAIDLIERLHPNVRLRSMTATYNCAGMVIASRRAHAGIEDVRRVLQDDGYVECRTLAAAQIGDVVLYLFNGEPVHVGIISEVRADIENAQRVIIVLSKWGDGGEYLHELQDVPALYGTATEVWTDRRVLK